MQLPDTLLAVLDAQRQIDFGKAPVKANEPTVRQRSLAARAVADRLMELVPGMGVDPVLGVWKASAGGAQGNASPVAWVRVHDATAPKATEGWYVVYLFSEDGRRAFLTVIAGSTTADETTFAKVASIRRQLGVAEPYAASRLGGGVKARDYAKVTVWAREYSIDDLRSAAEDRLLGDLNEALRVLVGLNANAATAGKPDIAEVTLMDVPDTIADTLRAYRNVVLEGVAGTGKSHLIGKLREEFGADRVLVQVFHPATSYEDFVEGLRPVDDGFAVRDGVFLEACRRAAEEASRTAAAAGVHRQTAESRRSPEFVLVVDEINRANTSKVLGDLLYALEPSKRVDAALSHRVIGAELDDPDVDVVYAVLQLERPVAGTSRSYRQRLCVPDNLFILGTMNTTDRSVGTIDLALRRRFVFQRFEPLSVQVLLEALDDDSFASDLEDWAELNERLATISPDAVLGHSYFFDFKAARARASNPSGLNLWRDLLLPQVAEVLVAFNALDRLEDLLGGIDAGGWTLVKVGTGIDAYPIPRRQAEAPPIDDDTAQI